MFYVATLAVWSLPKPEDCVTKPDMAIFDNKFLVCYHQKDETHEKEAGNDLCENLVDWLKVTFSREHLKGEASLYG